MSRGYPDFFGYSVHPEYGETTKQSHASVIIAAGTEHTLLDLTFKGRLLGGKLYTFQSAYDADQYISVEIDGVIVAEVSGQTDYVFEPLWYPNAVLRPCLIDHGRLAYSWAFVHDIYVNYSLIVTAINNDAADDYQAGVNIFYCGYEKEV